MEKGLLLCTAGTNVVRIAPPLTCTDDELQRGVALLGEAL
jgi:4-aminobutyrate aminotransferase-like enzyme